MRVYKTPEGKPYRKESLAVIKTLEPTKIAFGHEDDLLTLKSSAIEVVVNPATGGIYFNTSGGKKVVIKL